ncbi:SulP family inorganic anion transporter [Burkholderia aenigmatica]|uniref:SulP family inorganic anion transporter n=1 Tax=Burkholderia aenigmatica TaxID=2015348 RepID=UPI003B42E26E
MAHTARPRATGAASALRSDFVPALLLTASSAAEYIGLGVQALAAAHGAQAAALGAAIGLATAIVGLLVVAFGGGTQPLISGPRIAATVLMSQLVGTLLNTPSIASLGLFGALGCASLALACAGVTQLCLAALRGGMLVRMLPASALSGLLFGSAILAIADQAHAVTRCALDWWPTVVVVASGVGAHFLWATFAPRVRWPKGLSLFAALLAGTAAFYGFDALDAAPLACRTFGTVGFDPGLLGRPGLLQWPSVFARLDAGLLAMLVLYGAMIGVLAALDTLIAAGNVEADSRQRARPNRDLAAHGVANLVAAAAGLLPIVGSLTRSKLAWNAGGRTRGVAVLHAAMLLALVVAGTSLLALLPKLAAAAVMIAMALDMIDDWSRQIVGHCLSGRGPAEVVAAAVWTFAAVTAVTAITGQPGKGFAVGCVVALLSLLRAPRRFAIACDVQPDGMTVRATGALIGCFVDRKMVEPVLAQLAPGTAIQAVDIDLCGVRRFDASACRSLRQLGDLLAARGVSLRFVLAARQTDLRAALATFSVTRG